MTKKVTLSFAQFKQHIGTGLSRAISFLTKQKIGKIELTSKPWSIGKSENSTTKWIIDLEKGLFLKLVNEKEEYSEKQSIGELINEIMDLISKENTNNYLNVILYQKSQTPTQESRINEYGRKPKTGVQNNYPKEIAQKTGTREDAVRLWLRQMEVDPLTILQGIGSGRINRNDFVDALMSDNGTLEFLKKYNSDGKWSSVWKGAVKNESKYPTINLIKKMIKEEWVSFGSHRTHEKAERILGQLPTAKTSFRHEGQYYELDSEQISKIKNLKSVKIRTKLPGNESDWVNVWK